MKLCDMYLYKLACEPKEGCKFMPISCDDEGESSCSVFFAQCSLNDGNVWNNLDAK